MRKATHATLAAPGLVGSWNTTDDPKREGGMNQRPDHYGIMEYHVETRVWKPVCANCGWEGREDESFEDAEVELRSHDSGYRRARGRLVVHPEESGRIIG